MILYENNKDIQGDLTNNEEINDNDNDEFDVINKEENDDRDEEKKEEVKRFKLNLKIRGGEFAEIDGFTKDKTFKLRIITNKYNALDSGSTDLIKKNEEKGVITLKGIEANFFLKGPFYDEYIIVEVYCNK